MLKKIVSTVFKTAVPSLLKMGFDRVQQGGTSQTTGPYGKTAGLTALHTAILHKIQLLAAANAALETKLGILAASIVVFWGVVVGPADSADHRGWLVAGGIMLGLGLLTALAGMWTHPHRSLVVDFSDPKYYTYADMDDQPLVRKLIATAERSTLMLHKANALKTACYRYGVLLFAAGAVAVTIALLRDSL